MQNEQNSSTYWSPFGVNHIILHYRAWASVQLYGSNVFSLSYATDGPILVGSQTCAGLCLFLAANVDMRYPGRRQLA